ncbi:sterile alpha motif domain-containing protein 1-like [Anomalospiza imberbis]|uniref:sterile alpha motif domain-containing protein 1-like n=1 Tax=Anomalospiza imberbis TaxID=187417 RepID=UPI00358FB7BE
MSQSWEKIPRHQGGQAKIFCWPYSAPLTATTRVTEDFTHDAFVFYFRTPQLKLNENHLNAPHKGSASAGTLLIKKCDGHKQKRKPSPAQPCPALPCPDELAALRGAAATVSLTLPRPGAAGADPRRGSGCRLVTGVTHGSSFSSTNPLVPPQLPAPRVGTHCTGSPRSLPPPPAPLPGAAPPLRPRPCPRALPPSPAPLRRQLRRGGGGGIRARERGWAGRREQRGSARSRRKELPGAAAGPAARPPPSSARRISTSPFRRGRLCQPPPPPPRLPPSFPPSFLPRLSGATSLRVCLAARARRWALAAASPSPSTPVSRRRRAGARSCGQPGRKSRGKSGRSRNRAQPGPAERGRRGGRHPQPPAGAGPAPLAAPAGTERRSPAGAGTDPPRKNLHAK